MWGNCTWSWVDTNLKYDDTTSWGRFKIKMSSYQYRNSHCGDKTILRSSYLHNGISYTGKMRALYKSRPDRDFHTHQTSKEKRCSDLTQIGGYQDRNRNSGHQARCCALLNIDRAKLTHVHKKYIANIDSGIVVQNWLIMFTCVRTFCSQDIKRSSEYRQLWRLVADIVIF